MFLFYAKTSLCYILHGVLRTMQYCTVSITNFPEILSWMSMLSIQEVQ